MRIKQQNDLFQNVGLVFRCQLFVKKLLQENPNFEGQFSFESFVFFGQELDSFSAA